MTRRAFTLLEILVVVVILGGLIIVVFGVFAVGVSGFKLGTVRLDLQSELRRIVNPLRRTCATRVFNPPVLSRSIAMFRPIRPTLNR